MYTQCPDCSTAFRVTAEVLKQAAGKVRCGGCGIAFNALEYLSEQMPDEPQKKDTEAPTPELTADTELAETHTPKAISAEQSAALLKTLDELAGSDIRIEDTGVEWRVLGDDAAEEDQSASEAANQGVDELLDESPTPVDQFLTKTPNNIDASEIFEESDNAAAQASVDELRFDDNTPLPDDFDLDEEASDIAEPTNAGAPEDESQTEDPPLSEHPRDADEAPGDIALGEPEEWADILGEFTEAPEPYVPPLDAELSALEEVLDTGDDDEAPDARESETPPDMDTQFALQAEAMGIDLSGLHAANADETAAHDLDERAEEPEVTAAADEEAGFEEPSQVSVATNDTELRLADETPADETGEQSVSAESGDTAESGEVPELELADETGEDLEPDSELDEGPEPADELDAEEVTLQHSLTETNADGDGEDAEAPLEFGSIEKAMEELEEQSDVFDQRFFAVDDSDQAAIHDAPDTDDGVLEVEQDDEAVRSDDRHEEDDGPLKDELASHDLESDGGSPHVVPPQSEEEQTLNRLIDQELLSMAVEDEDGFASTIIVAESDAHEALSKGGETSATEDVAGFESIVMEGEFVRNALDQDKRKTDVAAAALLAEEANRAKEAEAGQTGSRNRRGMMAAAVLLVLVLVVQVLHQSREALATIPVFNDTVGPLYRAIGMPLSPAWDVTGWRFEARRDILDDEADTLTVISRIGNTSEKPLPYPLITISLTDRFEETIGTRTLDPADYLTNDLDPSKMVRPGNNFTAVMTIESPAENATGYKLQACYRQPDAQLRCYIPNFK